MFDTEEEGEREMCFAQWVERKKERDNERNKEKTRKKKNINELLEH